MSETEALKPPAAAPAGGANLPPSPPVAVAAPAGPEPEPPVAVAAPAGPEPEPPVDPLLAAKAARLVGSGNATSPDPGAVFQGTTLTWQDGGGNVVLGPRPYALQSFNPGGKLQMIEQTGAGDALESQSVGKQTLTLTAKATGPASGIPIALGNLGNLIHTPQGNSSAAKTWTGLVVSGKTMSGSFGANREYDFEFTVNTPGNQTADPG